MLPVIRLDQADASRINNRLRVMVRRGDDISSPLRACGQIMLTSIERNFQAGGRYSAAGEVRGGSNRWVDLAPSTRRQRTGNYRILQGRGTLATSFHAEQSGNTLVVGTNLEYAAIHHTGGKTKPHTIKPTYAKALSFQGAGGRVVTKSVQHPGSKIPARPILVVQDQDVDDMLEIISNHITR